jgi:general secretion pathway protein A
VNLVLVGQPELADRLNDPSLRQLKQRVVLRCSLEPLELRSAASYIAARLQVAGGSPRDVFTKDAIVAIFEASRGIPRTIGVICENALLAGFAAQKKPVDGALVAEVCKDLDLPGNGRPPRAAGGRQSGAAGSTESGAPKGQHGGSAAGSRRWFSFGTNDMKADGADDEGAAPAADDGKGMFRFF